MRLLNWTTAHFRRHEVDSARLAAEILLAHCLGRERIELYASFDYQPTADELADFRHGLKRVAAHEPVAYVVGHKEFYSLRFKVTPDVLIPRPETELLVARAVEHLRLQGRPGRMWDVCTGSGCVAVAVARQVSDAWVLATDVCPEALAVAAENAEAHGLSDRVCCRAGDLLNRPDQAGELEPFDVIAANPPYVGDDEPVAPEVAHEPQIALRAGPDGLRCIRRIIAGAPESLTAGGILVMEFGCGQAGAVWDLIGANGAFEAPVILRDHQRIERAVVAKKRR